MTKKRILTREFVLGLIVLAFMGYMLLTTQFSSRNGLFSMMLDVSPTILGAIAMSLVIFTGNIDISAGTILGFVSFTAGQLAMDKMPMVFFVPAALLVGVVLAGLNGWITVTFKVPSIVVTLAMNMVHLGFYATFLPNSGWIENLGDNFTWFGRGMIFGVVPYIFIVSIIVAALFIFLMRYTRFGKSVYAVGGNRQGAIYAGINPDSTVMKVFLVEGLLLGVAGLLKAMTRSDVLPSSFQGREMTFIAAAVVGGVNIMGGGGKLIGAVFGALLVYLLSTAMIYMGFQDYYQFALQGVIILIAVFITVTDFGAFRKKRASNNGPAHEGS
ncbi:MAG TPA: ABC transporter permease [Spirochaetia bacterium]|nr:ABC transporter permease [Spirochaetia bacterium]